MLRCRTTRHRAVGDVGPSGTPLAGSRDREGGGFTPLFPAGGSPVHVDSCGLGAESDFTPRAGSEDRDLEMPVANGLLAGSKRSRGGQVRWLCRGIHCAHCVAKHTSLTWQGQLEEECMGCTCSALTQSVSATQAALLHDPKDLGGLYST